jgi:serine/threonine protein kinase
VGQRSLDPIPPAAAQASNWAPLKRLRGERGGYTAAVLATDTVLGGRYLLGPMLGRGGVADVYRAEDRETGKPVAIKVLRNATTTDLRRLEREARALELLDHPAIVRLRDEGEYDGSPYLVLDLVEGEPLSHVIERNPLSDDEVARIGTSLAGALAHAHELGIVHRDVKPGNVLVDQEDAVHLTDFGIARLVDTSAITSITETGFVIGTAAYLAPEQVRGESAGPEADVYSLGLVLLEARTGERAFPGAPTESAMARLEHPPDIPVMTPWLASLLGAMTAPEPAQRPRAVAVADACANRADTVDHTAVLPIVVEPTAAVPAAVPPPVIDRPVADRPVVDPRWRLLAVLGAVVVALALILFAAARDGSSSVPPANADTSTTTPTAPPATAPVTQPTTQPTNPPPPKGDNKGKGGGDDGQGKGGGD